MNFTCATQLTCAKPGDIKNNLPGFSEKTETTTVKFPKMKLIAISIS